MSKEQWKGRESKANKVKRAHHICELLQKYYPDAHCALHHETPLQLLIATILSAQCTDDRVNMVTPALFERYPTAQDFAKAKQADVETLIHSTGFYKNKAKNIIKCCQDIVALHKGEVPQNLNSLVKLAGVGRKTANVVLGNAFDIPSGIVVDTHVTRLSNRLGLVKGKNAEIIERELIELIPKEDWIQFSHWLIFHGRQVCKARKPQCERCFLITNCPQRGL